MSKFLWLDLETTGLDYKTDEILKIGAENQDGIYWIVEDISDLKGYNIIGHNIKFDLNFINYHHKTQLKPYLDTLIMSYLAYPEHKQYGLKHMAVNFLKVPNWSEDTFGLLNKQGKKARTLAEVLWHKTPEVLKAMMPYLRKDVKYTKDLFFYLGARLTPKELSLAKFLTELDFLISQNYGHFQVDVEKCEKLKQEYTQNLREINKVLNEKYCLDNPNSAKQVRELLFDRLNFKPIEFTEKGEPKTSKDVLKKLKELNNHEVFELLLEYRQKQKMLSSFLKPWSENPRFKPRFSLTGTVSGRTSCSGPNIQQVPKGHVRELFIAPEGYDFVEIDYSQMELRIAGVVAGVSKILEAFNNGADLHTQTHINLFGRPDETKKERGIAKVANFGLLYGMSAIGFKAFASTSGIELTLAEAEEIRNNFFKAYPELLDYYAKCKKQLAKTGTLTSAIGRVYKVDKNVFLGDRFYRSSKERSGINALVQGYASDLLLSGLYTILTSVYVDVKDIIVIGTVHDSILMYVRKESQEESIQFCVDSLEHKEVGVPIKVDVEITGKSWK